MTGRPTATGQEATLARLGVKPSMDLALVEAIDRLERSYSAWGRAQVVEALSAVLPTRRTASAGQARQVIEAATDMLLAHPDIFLSTCPDRPDGRHGGLRYSTWSTLQAEQVVLDIIEAGRPAGVAVAPMYPATADPHLGADHAEAVRRIVAGGERVAVLVGPAGSGKSRTPRRSRPGLAAGRGAGARVSPPPPSPPASWPTKLGSPPRRWPSSSSTCPNRRSTLDFGEVIVCDEASMVSTRGLARPVLLADAAGAKVVLVGDHYQLGSVDAGGLFRLLAADAKTAELTGIRRFSDP